jgi:hypothetical protein
MGIFLIGVPTGIPIGYVFEPDGTDEWWFKKVKPEFIGRGDDIHFKMLKNYVETSGYTPHGHAITDIDAPIDPMTVYHIFTSNKAKERGYELICEMPDDMPMYRSKYGDEDDDEDDEEGIPHPFDFDEEPEY